jgi:photosystem II stability/assembly factor-like uncharacterized protein
MGDFLCLLVGNDRGLFRLTSRDHGESWQPEEDALSGIHVCALQATPGGDLLAGTRGEGMFCAHVPWTEWQPVPTPKEALKIRSFATLGNDVLVGTEPAAVYRFTLDSQEWTRLGEVTQAPGASEWFYPVPTEEVHIRHLATDPHQAERLYAAVQVGGVAISPDDGETWYDRRSLDLDVHMIEPHPIRPGQLYAGTGGDGLFRSTDAGDTWMRVSDGCGNFVVQFALTPGRPERMYLGTGRGHPPKWSLPEGARGEMFRSEDGGQSWTKLRGGLPDGLGSRISALRVDQRQPDHVFFGAGLTFRGMNPPDNGVYHSPDAGETWRKVLDAREPEVIWSGTL